MLVGAYELRNSQLTSIVNSWMLFLVSLSVNALMIQAEKYDKLLSVTRWEFSLSVVYVWKMCGLFIASQYSLPKNLFHRGLKIKVYILRNDMHNVSSWGSNTSSSEQRVCFVSDLSHSRKEMPDLYEMYSDVELSFGFKHVRVASHLSYLAQRAVLEYTCTARFKHWNGSYLILLFCDLEVLCLLVFPFEFRILLPLS